MTINQQHVNTPKAEKYPTGCRILTGFTFHIQKKTDSVALIYAGFSGRSLRKLTDTASSTLIRLLFVPVPLKTTKKPEVRGSSKNGIFVPQNAVNWKYLTLLKNSADCRPDHSLPIQSIPQSALHLFDSQQISIT